MKMATRNGTVDPVLVDLHERLTGPDKEDWLILVDGDTLHLMCVQEINGQAHGMKTRMTTQEFKSSGIWDTSFDKIGCVTVILPTDSEKTGGDAMMAWLDVKARVKNFSLMSVMGNVKTKQAAATFGKV